MRHKCSADAGESTVINEQSRAGSQSFGDEKGCNLGAVELFVRDFNEYEARANLFARCKDEHGFEWWDLVRYSVQFALCAEKGIYPFRPAERKSLPARARSFFRQCTLLLLDALKIARMTGSQIKRVYVYGRRCGHLLREIERSATPCLIVGDNGAACGPHVAIHKRSIDFFIRISSKLIRPTPGMVSECARLNAEINERFGTRVDVRQIILRKYSQHRAARVAWSFILSRLTGVELVGFVGDDTLKTLVYLANTSSTRTREFQHGYMGASHINYSYPELTVPVRTLPSEVVVHRNSGDIVYPVAVLTPTEVDAVSNETDSSGPRDIDVLIGGSPTRSAEMISIIEALVDKGLALALKLHPIQSESSSGVRDRFTSDQILIFPNDSDFVTLARRARVYVPANPTSTTVFEAVESGAKLIVVNYGGVKMTSMQDSIVCARVDSFEDLHQAVLTHLGQSAESVALC